MTSYNGKKIGSEYLTPYSNDYNRWVQVQTFDVTEQLREPGDLCVLLDNGWYKGRYGHTKNPKPFFSESWRLIAEVRIRYANGSEEVIGTDESWSITRSTITFSNIYDGEHRDDTLRSTDPLPARLVDAPKGVLSDRRSLPVVSHELFSARELIHTPAGETVLDMGQNIAGIFRLRVHEKKGTTIRLQFGEILQNGNFYNENLRSAKAEYRYVCDGTDTIVEPRFTFYGYRYVKIEGAERFAPEDFTAVALYSDLSMRGTLSTGNDLINKLIENTRWGMKDNFLDVPTDCPQRDERLGWTGDAQVFSPTALYLSDTYAFYAKYLYDMAQEQQEHDGMVPYYVPYFEQERKCAAAWGDAGTIIPWNMYLFSGDPSILRRQYPAMKAWVDYIARLDGDNHGWRRVRHFGDWLALDSGYGGADQVRGATDEGFIADVYYRKSALLMAKTARLLGKTEDEHRYAALADHILSGIREEYYSATGRCCISTQTAALLTLDEQLHDQERARASLAEQMNMSGGKLKTGFIGTPILCKVLSENGMADRAFDLLLNEDYPGWLYEVKMGATTVWERWNSVDPDGSISSTGMNSLNHYAYGSIVGWLFDSVAGIRPCEDAPGFRRAVIRPMLDRKLRKVRMSYPSDAGTYRIAWEILDKDHIHVEVSVPFNCEALLTLPLSDQGEQLLSAGEYSFHYQANPSIRAGFSSFDPVGRLLTNAKAKEILLRFLPAARQLPTTMWDMSLRMLAKGMGQGLKPELLDQLDDALSEL